MTTIEYVIQNVQPVMNTVQYMGMIAVAMLAFAVVAE